MVHGKSVLYSLDWQNPWFMVRVYSTIWTGTIHGYLIQQEMRKLPDAAGYEKTT